MKVTFIDEDGGTVTITDPITVEGDAVSLMQLAEVLTAGVERARRVPDVLVRVIEGPVPAGAGASERNPDSDVLPAVAMPWESSVPPPVELNDWQLNLLRRTRVAAVKVQDILGEHYQWVWVLKNSDPTQEHRLFSLTYGHAAIAPAGLYALDQAERAEMLQVPGTAVDVG